MQVVYVLKSEKDNKLYIGCTQNILQRLDEHSKGLVPSTKNRRPLKLIFTEPFENKTEAFLAERFYKTSTGKRQLKKKLLAQ